MAYMRRSFKRRPRKAYRKKKSYGKRKRTRSTYRKSYKRRGRRGSLRGRGKDEPHYTRGVGRTVIVRPPPRRWTQKEVDNEVETFLDQWGQRITSGLVTTAAAAHAITSFLPQTWWAYAANKIAENTMLLAPVAIPLATEILRDYTDAQQNQPKQQRVGNPKAATADFDTMQSAKQQMRQGYEKLKSLIPNKLPALPQIDMPTFEDYDTRSYQGPAQQNWNNNVEIGFRIHGRGDYMMGQNKSKFSKVDLMQLVNRGNKQFTTVTGNPTAMKVSERLPTRNPLPPEYGPKPAPQWYNPGWSAMPGIPVPVGQPLQMPEPVWTVDPMGNQMPGMKQPAPAAPEPTGYITGPNGETVPIYNPGGVNNPDYFNTGHTPETPTPGVAMAPDTYITPRPSDWDTFWNGVWDTVSGGGHWYHGHY